MAEKYPSLELCPAKVKEPELRSGEFVLYWIEPYEISSTGIVSSSVVLRSSIFVRVFSVGCLLSA